MTNHQSPVTNHQSLLIKFFIKITYNLDYWKYDLLTSPETAEILLAFLGDAPFDTFEETAAGLHAYLPADADQVAAEMALADLSKRFAFSWEKTFLPAQNWNEIWESNFHPVIVGDFCAVRADFHAPIEGVRHELVINPKMAFGTGHHETTWQCIAAMEHLPIAGKHLLDYGCGTGILAILAARLGAAEVEAVDIEAESYRNTLENSAINQTSQVVARCGTIAAVEGSHFDGILANINRNVILDSLPRLSALTKPGGWLLVSGILEPDEAIVTETAEANGFVQKSRTQRGNWLCCLYLSI